MASWKNAFLSSCQFLLRSAAVMFFLSALPLARGQTAPEVVPNDKAEENMLQLQVPRPGSAQDTTSREAEPLHYDSMIKLDPPIKVNWPLIREVRVETFDSPLITQDEVLAISGLKLNEACLPCNLRWAVKFLFETKRVENVRIYQKDGADGAHLVLVVQAAPDTEEMKVPKDIEGNYVEGIAAVVNREVILHSDLQKALTQKETSVWYGSEGEELNQKLAAGRGDVLQNLIELKLLLSEYKKRKYLLVPTAGEQLLLRRIESGYAGDKEAMILELDARGETMDSIKLQMIEQAKISKVLHEEISPKLLSVADDKRAEEWRRLIKEWLQELRSVATIRLYSQPG